MKKTSKPIVFFGTEAFSAVSLSALLAADYTISLVITKPDSRKGRGQKVTAPLVKKIALDAAIPVLQPHKLTDAVEAITALSAPVGILVSYGKIIPQKIIDLFQPAIINVHPSLLPKYRGPSPIEAAILHGDAATGISIMKLTKDMDAGPVYRQSTYSLTRQETSLQLYDILATKGAELLVKTLPGILSGKLAAQQQNEAQASYCRLLAKSDGQLDPISMTAAECERAIRAYAVYPKAKAIVHGQLCTITEAHVSSQPAEDAPALLCKDKNFLIITNLVAPNGKKMSGQAFLRGYKQ